MAIRDLITADNLLSYASAGIEVARAIQRLRAQGYESMVVPSRGAVPVLHVAQSYYRTMVAPMMSRDDRVAKHALWHLGPLTLDFLAPFTADAGQLGVDGLETAQIRRYWTKVIAAITRGDVNHPAYRFYRFVRDDVCRVGFHPALEWRMRSPRLIFIDTVVSGRAVAEIADGFEQEGMDQIHYLLLLDENGSRMKSDYARRIRALEAAGRATLIRVPSLFTEDQGPAVSGIWSVVFPKLMEMSRAESVFDDGIVGAGLYYVEVRQREDRSNQAVTMANAKLHHLLYLAMHVAARPDDIAEDIDDLGARFADDDTMRECFARSGRYRPMIQDPLELYLRHIEENGLFDQAFTERIAAPRLSAGATTTGAQIDVSSSHCLRMNVSDDEAARLIKQFNASLARPYWADAECTKRAEA